MPRGCNLDPLNPAGDPQPAELLARGFTAVRLVSKPDPNGSGVHPHIEERLAQYKAAGISALVVITAESQGRIPANNHGLLQLGNEPDGQPPSSQVQTPEEYVADWQTYTGTYPQFRWIAAGLCSGDPSWWAQVGPQLGGCAGVAVHLYKTPLDQAETLLERYRAVRPDRDLYVTEWNPLGAWSLGAYDWAMRTRTAGAFYFAWSDGMVPGFGLFRADGTPKPQLAAFHPTSSSAPAPTPAPAPLLHRYESGNFWPGRPYGPPIAIVLHTEAGTEASTEAWFTNDSAQVSAHFGVGLDGRDDQFVQLGDTAWANGIREPGNAWDAHGLPDVNPNYLTVSIETEDRGNNAEPVTDAQYAAALADCRLALRTYPQIKWLLRHADISPSSRAHCPGDRWIASGRFAQLARDLGLTTL